ncbi:MAG TPA: ABC transporter permease [Ktedonobacteraceae bacterium]|nr:ABC transporter permease [Ktedonobacteraceae bacterium]
MQVTQSNDPEKFIPAQPRTSSVIMGRQDYLSTVLRLIGMELYKIRHRIMSKVLAALAIIATIAVFVVIMLLFLITANTPVSSYVSVQCQPGQTCPQPNATDLQQAQVQKQTSEASISQALRIPGSLALVNQVCRSLVMIFIIILFGTVVGGEYSVGTIRLLFTRGPTRTQFLLGKMGTALAIILLTILVLVPLGIIVGLLCNLVTGISPSVDGLSAAWFGQVILFFLSTALGLFLYAMMAICFSTLGRATAAGVAGALSWAFIEPLASTLLSAAGNFTPGNWGDIIKAIPDYLPGNNLGALITNESPRLPNTVTTAPTLSTLHAISVLVVYLAIFIGISLWVNVRRNVTN